MAAIVKTKREAWHRVVVVVSAIGSRPAVAAGSLRGCAGRRGSGRHRGRFRKHLEAGSGPETGKAIEGYIRELENLYHAVTVLREASPRAMDAIASLGERMSIQIVAGYLKPGRSVRRPPRSVPLPADQFQISRKCLPDHARTPGRAQPVFEPMLFCRLRW